MGISPSTLGDGLLIYFGYPYAHEDDAQRAVRAGLEYRAGYCAPEIPTSHKDKGVYLSRAPGDSHRSGGGWCPMGKGCAQREPVALGETPNIAARFARGEAMPDTVVISAATHSPDPGTLRSARISACTRSGG